MKAVIFDLDGVLVDACEWHRIALNEALKEICEYEIGLEEHYTEFNGLPTKTKLKKLAVRNIINNDLNLFNKIEQLKQIKTIDAINQHAFVRNEKVELMKFLRSKDIKIVCYTNSIRKTANLMLEKTGILNYFDFVVTNQDVANPKPNPEGYILSMKKLDIIPDEVIIIEDSDNGFKAAKSSGANVIRVKNQEEVDIKLLENYI
jgi:beta-phosphoglucomutase-like phosphatase (HAD superfamily)